MTTYSTAFLQSMANRGLAGVTHVIEDGKFHRFTVDGDRNGSKAGWYILFPDRVPAGAFGSWKTGEQYSWSAKRDSELTTIERKENWRKFEEANRQRRIERDRRQSDTAVKSVQLWEGADSANPNHPYLLKKRVEPYTLRQSGDVLLAPLIYQRQIVNLQQIFNDGSKRFLPGGRVTGCYYGILGTGDALYLCEGVATGHTIHALTGKSVACAMNCGNLLHVAKYLRGKYPDLRIVIAADNDSQTPGNPGKVKGIEAAQAIDALVTWPTFPEENAGTDFNDLENLGVDDGL